MSGSLFAPAHRVHGAVGPGRYGAAGSPRDPYIPRPSREAGDGDWLADPRVACREEDPELFFPVGHAGPSHDQVVLAKAVCGRCPLRRQCLEYALSGGGTTDYGIWGGLTEDERREERSSRWRQRRGRR
jgi:WhiB family redox-sensing transcriptional regulator